MNSKYIVKLKDRKNGETKEIPYTVVIEHGPESSPDNELDFVKYMWHEGNDGCDCNKYDYFYPDDNIDYPCWNPDFKDGRFEVVSIEQTIA